MADELPRGGRRGADLRARDPRKWRGFAGEVAKHARGEIDNWEIVNEPDANWAFTGSAEDYARMLSAAYDAIKSEAPGAKVVFGGVERPREHEWVQRVFATPDADAAHKFDIAAVHLRLGCATACRSSGCGSPTGAGCCAAMASTVRSGSPSTATRPPPYRSGTRPTAAPT